MFLLQCEAENQLEVADEDRKHAHDSLSILRIQHAIINNKFQKDVMGSTDIYKFKLFLIRL
jgi:hypothetical protein